MRRFLDRGGRDRRVDLLELTRRPRTHREKQFDGRKSFVRAISPNAPERAAGNPLPSTDLISCLYAHLELSRRDDYTGDKNSVCARRCG
jgi:hypothetical protein